MHEDNVIPIGHLVDNACAQVNVESLPGNVVTVHQSPVLLVGEIRPLQNRPCHLNSPDFLKLILVHIPPSM
jgi:hypothetical protein